MLHRDKNAKIITGCSIIKYYISNTTCPSQRPANTFDHNFLYTRDEFCDVWPYITVYTGSSYFTVRVVICQTAGNPVSILYLCKQKNRKIERNETAKQHLISVQFFSVFTEVVCCTTAEGTI